MQSNIINLLAKIKNSPVSCLCGQNFRVGRWEKDFISYIILFLVDTLFD